MNFVQSILKRGGLFWFFQLSGWGAYTILLILSTIPFASDTVLIAYRATLAVSAFAGTFVLRVVCRRELRRGFRFPRSLAIVLACSAILTCLCSALALKVEYALGSQMRPFTLLLAFTTIT